MIKWLIKSEIHIIYNRSSPMIRKKTIRIMNLTFQVMQVKYKLYNVLLNLTVLAFIKFKVLLMEFVRVFSSFCQVNGVNSPTSEVSEAMVKTFQGNVEMLLERMQKVSGQGKHIAMDATVQVGDSIPFSLAFLLLFL